MFTKKHCFIVAALCSLFMKTAIGMHPEFVTDIATQKKAISHIFSTLHKQLLNQEIDVEKYGKYDLSSDWKNLEISEKISFKWIQQLASNILQRETVVVKEMLNISTNQFFFEEDRKLFVHILSEYKKLNNPYPKLAKVASCVFCNLNNKIFIIERVLNEKIHEFNKSLIKKFD